MADPRFAPGNFLPALDPRFADSEMFNSVLSPMLRAQPGQVVKPFDPLSFVREKGLDMFDPSFLWESNPIEGLNNALLSTGLFPNLEPPDPQSLLSALLGGGGSAPAEPLPPFQPGLPPVRPKGPAMLDLGDEQPFPTYSAGAAPNFSEAESWLDKAKPVSSTNPDEARRQRLADWLAGVTGAVGSVNGGEAGIGQLLALAAGGGAGALSTSRREERELQREDNKANQAYAASRGGFAADKATALAAYSQRAAAAKYANEVAAYQRGQAKVLDAKDGYLIVQKGNKIQTIPYGATTALYDQLETMGKALGEDHSLVRQQKYDLMVDQQVEVEAFQAQIIRDLIQDGLAPTVFPQVDFEQVLSDAQDAVPPTVTGKDALPLTLNTAAGLILGALQNDPSWLINAAQAGNYGAQLLLQGSNLGAQ